MINSRNKGKVGEREFAGICRDHGYDARRGQQYNGLDGEDVVGLEYIHPEVKRVEQLNIHKAMEQSIRDCQGKIPIVAHRKNHKDWLITMRANDWFTFYNEYYSDMKLQERQGTENDNK
jgi:Holliday junction resolvase